MRLRTRKEPDDLLGLYALAKRKLKGIEVSFQKHEIAKDDGLIERLIGYYPTGEFQILFEKDKKVISCIRGSVSFGNYELMGIENIDTGDPVRFGTPKEVIKWVKKQL